MDYKALFDLDAEHTGDLLPADAAAALNAQTETVIRPVTAEEWMLWAAQVDGIHKLENAPARAAARGPATAVLTTEKHTFDVLG